MKHKVYELVKKIPKGKVTTYKILASLLKTSPRAIGKILNKNKNKDVPCHRVVMSNGSVGGYNKGIDKKIVLLKKEGLIIKNKKIINFRVFKVKK